LVRDRVWIIRVWDRVRVRIGRGGRGRRGGRGGRGRRGRAVNEPPCLVNILCRDRVRVRVRGFRVRVIRVKSNIC
jgi:hypothetical protein